MGDVRMIPQKGGGLVAEARPRRGGAHAKMPGKSTEYECGSGGELPIDLPDVRLIRRRK